LKENTIFRIRKGSFGISTAEYIFSKVLREVVKDFRSKKDKRIIMFLNDGLAGEKTIMKPLLKAIEN